MNLAVNARDAMSKGGTLSVSVRAVEFSADAVRGLEIIPAGRYAALVVKTLRDAGLRADIDDRALTTNKKVREAELSRVNYILVVGDKEVEAQTVNVRTRDNAILGEKALNDFCAMLVDEARSRRA